MSAQDWEKRVLAAKGAEERVTEIEQELLLANGIRPNNNPSMVLPVDVVEYVDNKMPF